jgi:endonuclease YncB( thermonuclease family)
VIGAPVVAAESVLRVIDGDTILLDDGRKVRYAGINAPEQGDPYFRESTQANNLLVGGKEVRLEFGRGKTEKHQRELAYIYVGPTLVQAELVKQGWAIVTRAQSIPRYRKILLKYQEEARVAGRGIWGKAGVAGELIVVRVHPRPPARSKPNDEYVVFRNTRATSLDLTGWSISDEADQSYLVPQFTLGPGKTFTLYTGSGKSTSQALYWGRRKPVWNKGGDTVIVRDAAGHFVLSHTY